VPSYTSGSASDEILPEGSEWAFLVVDATEKQSSTGNEMIELKLQLFDLNGQKIGVPIYDYLPFTEKMFRKIDAFRATTGDKIVPGQTVILNADDCIDRHGRLTVTVDSYQGKSKNKVAYYVLPGESSANSSPATAAKSGRSTAPVGQLSKNEFGEPSNIPF
jgi:hypothetical protein